MCLVGLDVHQGQSVAAVLDPLSGELRVERLRGVPGDVVPVFLEALGRPVRAVYDRRNATRLVRLFAAGELSFSFVRDHAMRARPTILSRCIVNYSFLCC